MYRSGSTSRFSDDHFSYYGSSSSPSSKVPTALRALSDNDSNELPMYEPLSMADKKERSRAKFAEKAVHAIPLVLLLCAFILWIFSNPGQSFSFLTRDFTFCYSYVFLILNLISNIKHTFRGNTRQKNSSNVINYEEL